MESELVRTNNEKILVAFVKDYIPPGRTEPIHFRGERKVITRPAANTLGAMGYCYAVVGHAAVKGGNC